MAEILLKRRISAAKFGGQRVGWAGGVAGSKKITSEVILGSAYAIGPSVMPSIKTICQRAAKKVSLGGWVGLLILIAQPVVAATSVPLAWNPSLDVNVAGYKIYYGVASQTYTNWVDVGNVTNVVINGLMAGNTYYFAATTYDVSGVESDFSNEAVYALTAAPVYQAPSLNTPTNLTINENAGQQTVSLTGISLGSGQTLTLAAVSSNPALIPNPAVSFSSPNTSGSLTFTPVANVSGTATITVTANNGQPSNNIVTQTFTVNVAAVNQLPTLNSITNVTLSYNSPAQTVSLSGISSGAAGEFQPLTVKAVSSNPKVVANPTVSYSSPLTTGALTVSPVANASGSATITVTVNDGGASNNIVTRTFTVTVTAKNYVAAPVVSKSPQSQRVLAGKSATFTVTASGKGTLKYQWKYNGTNVTGGTSATLTVKSCTAKQAGLYSVTVANSGGSAASAPAALVIADSPAATLTSAVQANGQFAFNVEGVTGYKYAVQASTDLVHWTAVQTNAAPFTFTDPNASQVAHQFYRTAYVP